MRRANQFSKAILAAIMVFGLLISTNVLALMDRIKIQHGGVIEDVQLLRRADGDSTGIAWAVNMETGVYRGVYNPSSISHWDSWQEFRPGLTMNGVEAVQDTESGGGSHEYVMFTTQNKGMYYARDPQYGATPYHWGHWQYPNGPTVYPAAWKTVFVGDAAFYYDADAHHYPDPETQFFVMLGMDITNTTPPQHNGLYKWDATLNPPNFKRVDDDPSSPIRRGFSNFWRDLYKQNVLYTIKTAVYNPDHTLNSAGGLWRFSGNYATGTFTPINDIIPNGYLIEVKGFNQWKEGNTVYSYTLVYWRDTYNVNHYTVFYSTNLATTYIDSIRFDEICDVDSSLFSHPNVIDEWPGQDTGGWPGLQARFLLLDKTHLSWE